MNTPNDLSDTQINALVDHGKLPDRKPEIDLRHAYDIVVAYEGSAPVWERYSAVDQNTYDGASEGGISSCIGRGPTPQAARFDLLEQIADERAKL